jgi:hypothetical protein
MAEVGERVAVLETQVSILDHDVEALEQQMIEVRLAGQEQKTNWRLAAAVGGLGGSAFISIVVFLATTG